ncbi:glycosyltransferase [Cytophagaceae bacterium 50C-KIRBA]|uniref:Glycosyltransferase n=1 Tax=Aquirufa beregesia TaxID=2516556 RepID=A0ABX0EU99_9BACT|nr:glycosyltransferase family 4 protein [Aquirufa beregesia]NGZ43152.1 glycosyltransferase [Aquirufa beregesia]
MSKKKILFFSSNLHRTGAEIVLFDIIHQLDASKFDIGLVLLERNGALVDQLAPHIQVYYLDTQFSIWDKVKFHAGQNVILQRLHAIQQQFGASVWYINTIQNAFILQFKDQFKVQTFLHVHEYLYNFEQLEIKDSQRLFDQVDYLVTCSDLVYHFFAPIFPKTCFVLQSGINKEWIDVCLTNFKKEKKKKKKVVSSGTICYRKGVDLFLEISQNFLASEYEFIWLGKWANNGYAEVIRRQMMSGQYPAVQFLDNVSQKEYYQELASADVFITCSREESMGLVAMEAIYCGVPVLATNSGGSSLIINEANGILSQDFRPTTLAKELNSILLKEFNVKKMRDSLLNFDLQMECQKLESYLLG